NLQVQISALRKVLGAPTIVTVPGRGYRFVAPLQRDHGAVPVPARAWRVGEAEPLHSGQAPLPPGRRPASEPATAEPLSVLPMQPQRLWG
ncbi:hypothetical protein ABTL53_19435, partial [Acinetobacter baumannii]